MDPQTEVFQRLKALHQDMKTTWENAAKLETQGRTIPAAKMRQQSQTWAWVVKGMIKTLEENKK